MKIRVMVGTRSSDGAPVLCAVTVECTQKQYDNGDHYIGAIEAVQAEYSETTEHAFVVDENDQFPAFIGFDDLPAFWYDISDT